MSGWPLTHFNVKRRLPDVPQFVTVQPLLRPEVSANRDQYSILLHSASCKITDIEYQLELLAEPCLQRSVKYEGRVLESLSVRTHLLCQFECDQERFCEFWSWSLSECVLLYSKRGSVQQYGWISGSRGCIPGITTTTTTARPANK